MAGNQAMNAKWPITRFQMEDQPRPPGYRKRYPAKLRGLKMDARQESNAVAKPTASACITFIAAAHGGRKAMPNLNVEPYYRPHIVVQDPRVRHATCDDAGLGNEHYMGVEFVAGPDNADFDVSLRCALRFMYYPRVDYSTATAGATFTVREGGRIVAHGTLNSVEY